MNVMDEVFKAYGISCERTPFGNGHINDTYIAGDFIIQKINTSVFKNPEELMSNILEVTSYLRKKLSDNGEDPERGTLTVIPTTEGKSYYTASDNTVYRVYKLIENSISYDKITPELLYKAAYGFGYFQKLLSDFDSGRLYETIPDFHNTPKRYEALMRAVSTDAYGRARDVKGELEYVNSRRDQLSVVIDGLNDGSIPTRVTHNDTKINNVLLDRDSGEYVAVIDLDTVMPGSLLYDYGDAVRSAANLAAEDERDLSRVGINYENVRSFTEGFLKSIGDGITPKEISLLIFSVKLIAMELGIRFLTDYLSGDTYFKTTREGQNLDRARCQLRLAQCVEENGEALEEIVRDCLTQ